MDEINGGTFTITNFGSFRNIIGTPIINQPQVAILATGSIEKNPAVMETPTGDAIVIRSKMFLSLSYDHRIIDGALGGAFLRRIADILEDFDIIAKFKRKMKNLEVPKLYSIKTTPKETWRNGRTC